MAVRLSITSMNQTNANDDVLGAHPLLQIAREMDQCNVSSVPW